MASVLKVNILTGVTTAGSIVVTGEGNSTTTNLQQGLAKAWINFNGTGTIASRDSFNVTSIQDNGSGQYQYAIANDMAAVNYARLVSAGLSGSRTVADTGSAGSNTAAVVVIITQNIGDASLVDVDDVNSEICGDLA